MRGYFPKGAVLAALVTGLAMAGSAAADDKLLADKCAGCHSIEGSDALTRISEQRKTPEGWVMTLFRMAQVHGVELNEAERRTLVKHLAE